MAETVRERTIRGGLTVPPDTVREYLARILSSSEFHSSKRCQEFLNYVVEKALSGQTDDLKERTIGMEVFGRPASYEPSTDATVRVKAGEVRKRLISYYSGTGQLDEVAIQLPPGGYIPEFGYVTGIEAASTHSLSSRSWLPLVGALSKAVGFGVSILSARVASKVREEERDQR